MICVMYSTGFKNFVFKNYFLINYTITKINASKTKDKLDTN